MKTTSCRLEQNTLTIENSRIRRVYDWNGGNVVSREIADKRSGKTWRLRNNAPDCGFPNESGEPADGELRVESVPAGPTRDAHLKAVITFRLNRLWIKREIRVHPGCPAIAVDFHLRGRAAGEWRSQAFDPLSLKNIETASAMNDGRASAVVLDRLRLDAPHLRVKAVEFFDATDRVNNLVREWEILPYRGGEIPMSGNILMARDILSDNGLFVLKEAPCSNAQLAWPGFDFIVGPGEIRTVGVGAAAGDLDETGWLRCHGVVVGVADGGEFGLLLALKQYQSAIRKHDTGRDEMIMLNTWGDRGQDTRICEAFALGELAAGARLGVTHFQLDAGWQSGKDSNSASPGGSLDNIWANANYWKPHPQRFPNGLAPVVAAAKKAGIELCLWFNPSKDDSYAAWEKDADVLAGMYREHGIRVFKIDGVMIADKRADTNLRGMLDKVMAACGGNAVFNMDVTAGRRWGYHYGNEYGNRFLENRYTDWANYYPHYTLRNLWQLSRCVPAQTLQIEFLNTFRNPDKYPENDPLAPARVSFEYAFASTIMAQPLAWFEAQNLPEQAFEAAPAIAAYRKIRHEIHAGAILPIGEEPAGNAWTGFQSIREDGGWFAVYRQLTDRPRSAMRVWGLAPGVKIALKSAIGQGRDFAAEVDETGSIAFELPRPFSYALYEYSTPPSA